MKYTIGQIAALLHAEVEGSDTTPLTGFGKIESAKPGELTFLSNPKYEPFIYTTQASAVLVSHHFTPQKPIQTTLIRVENPYEALATLLQMAHAQMAPQKRTGIDPTALVHPSAQVAEDAYIGAYAIVEQHAVVKPGCQIYPHVYIGANCQIGADTTIYPHATLYNDSVIGKQCILHAGCVIGADGFGFAPTDSGYKKIPHLGYVEIADCVEIGANSCVDRSVMGATSIGEGSKIDNLVQIAHNCKVGTHNAMAAQVGIAGSSTVGDWCQFGGQVGIPGHVSVGNHVKLGGQAGVVGNVPDHSTLIGSPATKHTTAMRSFVAVAKLPELIKKINQLEKQLKTLQTQQ